MALHRGVSLRRGALSRLMRGLNTDFADGLCPSAMTANGRRWDATGSSIGWSFIHGPAASDAGVALQHVDADALHRIAQRAGGSARDAPAALATLAAAGPNGLEQLRRLARLPALRGLAIDALGDSPDATASTVLVELASATASRYAVLAALERRALAGDATAIEGLLGLAEPPLEQAVLRALSRCGNAGLDALERAAENPRLRRLATELLERVRGRTERPAANAPPGGVMARTGRTKRAF